MFQSQALSLVPSQSVYRHRDEGLPRTASPHRVSEFVGNLANGQNWGVDEKWRVFQERSNTARREITVLG